MEQQEVPNKADDAVQIILPKKQFKVLSEKQGSET